MLYKKRILQGMYRSHNVITVWKISQLVNSILKIHWPCIYSAASSGFKQHVSDKRFCPFIYLFIKESP